MRFCIVTATYYPDIHHLVHRGAGGSDHENNLIYLRRDLHQEIHAIGTRLFAEKYPVVDYWLKAHAWHLEDGKWIAPPECRKKLKKIIDR